MEVDSGRTLPEAISRTDGDVISWSPDNSSFFYFRFNEAGPNTPASERAYNARTYLHRIGQNPAGAGDSVVFGRGVSKTTEVPEGQGTFVFTAVDSNFAVAVANHNLDENPADLYVAPLESIDGADTAWRHFATVADGVTQVELHGDTLYFLTLGGAPRFRIMATPLAHPDVRHARIVVPEGQGVITDFGIASDGLYYRLRNGSGSRLFRVDLEGRHVREIPLPFAAIYLTWRSMRHSRARCSRCRVGRRHRKSSLMIRCVTQATIPDFWQPRRLILHSSLPRKSW